MRFLCLISALILGFPTAGWAAASYQVNDGTQTSIFEHSICRTVANATGQAIFVPTNTLAEWTAFYTNAPAGITISSCVASQLVWTTQPAASIAAGANIVAVIEIQDSGGTTMTSGPDATANVTLSLQTGTGALAGTLTKAAVAGVVSITATEAVSINLIGAKTLRATKEDLSGSGGAGTLTADSTSFTIVHGAAAQIVYTTPPASTILSGVTFGPVLEIRDAAGNLVTSGVDATANVTLSVPTKPGNLTNAACSASGVVAAISGTVTVAASGGIATFSGISLNVGGSYVMRGTKADLSGSGGTIARTVDSSTFTLEPGVIAALYWKDAGNTTTNPDTTRTAGQNFSTGGVVACDATGNTATNSTDTITFEIDDNNNPTGDTVHGTATIALSSGVASLSSGAFSIYLAGTGYKLIATANSTGAESAGSGNVAVTAAPYTTMTFVGLASTWPDNVNVIPAVKAQVSDAFGNLRTSGCSGNATLTLTTNPGGAGTFAGTFTATQTACVYTWASVRVDVAATTAGFQVTATTANNLCDGPAPCVGQSSTFSVSTQPGLNLVHSIDLLDLPVGCRQGTGTQNANFTYTPFDANLYSGTVTYTLEVVASNTDGTARSIRLINNSSGTTDATAISVANGTSIARFTSTLTPTAGIANYRLQLDRCTTVNALKIHAARIIVTQASSNAYATVIHVPLMSALDSAFQSANLSTSPIDSTNSTTASQPTPERYAIWRYNAAEWASIPTAGFKFYADINSTNTATGMIAELWDRTDNVLVPGTTRTRTATGVNVSQTGWLNPALLTDGHEYEVRISTSNTSNTGRIHKAGLFIKVENMTKFSTYWRVSRLVAATATGLNDYNRTNFDKANFSSPITDFYCSGMDTSDGLTTELVSLGNTNTGGTITSVASSSLNFSGSKSLLSATGLTLPAGAQSYAVRFNGTPGALNLSHCYLVMRN